MAQKTLKEAAERYVKINVVKNAAKLMYKEHFIAGAKWQQEQDKNKYSEEDMKQFGLYLGDNFKKLKGKTIDEIFKQFLNK